MCIFCFTCDHICDFIDEKTYLVAIAAGNASKCLFASQFPKVKRNSQDAARSRDKVTGHSFFRNAELLPCLVEWVMWSAFLPSSEEFDAFWSSVFARMSSSKTKTDFNEKKFAKYMKNSLFDLSGPLLRVSWECGLGVCPPGGSTLTPNTIESSHRTLTSLLDPGFAKRDIGSLMVEVCQTIASRVEQGKFADMQDTLQELWKELIRSSRRRTSSTVAEDPAPEKKKVMVGCGGLKSVESCVSCPTCLC